MGDGRGRKKPDSLALDELFVGVRRDALALFEDVLRDDRRPLLSFRLCFPALLFRDDGRLSSE